MLTKNKTRSQNFLENFANQFRLSPSDMHKRINV